MGKTRTHARLRHAATLAFVSQGIHLAVLPGQFVAAMIPAFFFLFVAIGQGLLGASLLFGAGRWTLRLGILLNLFIVAVWTITRLVSVPELFEPLRTPIEGLGAVATLAEVVLIIMLFRLRSHVSPKSRKHRRVFKGIKERRG